jgi:drug/metabolite transporter (DMT)-like permease
MSVQTLVAVVLSFSAATLFALTTNLHRGAASAIPMEEGGPVRLLLRLLRTPRWLLGSLCALVALSLHTVALRFGTVIVVQAVLSTGLVLALGLEAFRERRRPRPGEVGGWLLVVAGIVLVLALAQPHGGQHMGNVSHVVSLLTAIAAAAAGLLVGRTRLPRPVVAVVMGSAAGACFALDAVFLKGIAGSVGHAWTWVAVFDLAGFIVASVLGNLVVQRAYQQAPLRHVLPAVTAADPVAASVIGVLILHEHLRAGQLAVVGLLVGLVAMVVGIVAATARVREDDPGSTSAAEPPARSEAAL